MLLQIPGGPELIVIFLITILIFGIPLLLVVVVGAIYLRAESGASGDDVAERVEDLEAEMSEVREQVGEESPSSAGSGQTGTSSNADRTDPANRADRTDPANRAESEDQPSQVEEPDRTDDH